VTPVLVDSNVLLDVASGDAVWDDWSSSTLERVADEAVLVINPLVYAEVSVGFPAIEEIEAALPADLYLREDLPYEAAFLAGKCFLRYRQSGGAKRSPLPDFYIGAHAAVAGYRLLTRDPTRYRTYFPTLELIAPGSSRSATSAASSTGRAAAGKAEVAGSGSAGSAWSAAGWDSERTSDSVMVTTLPPLERTTRTGEVSPRRWPGEPAGRSGRWSSGRSRE